MLVQNHVNSRFERSFSGGIMAVPRRVSSTEAALSALPWTPSVMEPVRYRSDLSRRVWEAQFPMARTLDVRSTEAEKKASSPALQQRPDSLSAQHRLAVTTCPAQSQGSFARTLKPRGDFSEPFLQETPCLVFCPSPCFFRFFSDYAILCRGLVPLLRWRL